MVINHSSAEKQASDHASQQINHPSAMFLETETRNFCRELSKPTEMDKSGTPLVWIRVSTLKESPSPNWQLQPQVLLYNSTLSYWNQSPKQSVSWYVREIYNWYEKASFLDISWETGISEAIQTRDVLLTHFGYKLKLRKVILTNQIYNFNNEIFYPKEIF